MYPNIICTRNVSPDVIRCDCRSDREDVPGLGYSICDERGYLVDVLHPIIDARDEIKAAIRREQQCENTDEDRLAELEGRSGALKWILVACFGYQGFSNAKFGRIECHEASNAFAREILLTAKQRLEAGGWRVVHGIVDSIWVTPDPDVDDDVIPLAAAFAAQTHGDARKAIDLMRVADELTEREGDARVREEHVREAQAKVEKNRVLEVVRWISTQKKLCLYATAAVAAQTTDGTARSTTGYRVYQYLTDAIDADQYHQETYVNKMKELTTYSLVDFERRSHGPSSGMFLEFQFAERPDTVLETLREDSRIEMVSDEEVESVVKAQIRNQS